MCGGGGEAKPHQQPVEGRQDLRAELGREEEWEEGEEGGKGKGRDKEWEGRGGEGRGGEGRGGEGRGGEGRGGEGRGGEGRGGEGRGGEGRGAVEGEEREREQVEGEEREREKGRGVVEGEERGENSSRDGNIKKALQEHIHHDADVLASTHVTTHLLSLHRLRQHLHCLRERAASLQGRKQHLNFNAQIGNNDKYIVYSRGQLPTH